MSDDDGLHRSGRGPTDLAAVVGQSTRIGGVGAVLAALGLVAVGGLPGAAGGLAAVVVWVTVADLAAYAVATVSLAAVVAGIGDPAGGLSLASASPTELAGVGLVALALGLLVLGGLFQARRSRLDQQRIVALAVAVLATLCAATIAPHLAGYDLVVATGVLLTVVALASYGLHRYALLVSGVLDRG